MGLVVGRKRQLAARNFGDDAPDRPKVRNSKVQAARTPTSDVSDGHNAPRRESLRSQTQSHASICRQAEGKASVAFERPPEGSPMQSNTKPRKHLSPGRRRGLRARRNAPRRESEHAPEGKPYAVKHKATQASVARPKARAACPAERPPEGVRARPRREALCSHAFSF